MIYKDCTLTELGEHDIENMFRGVYLKKPAHYQYSGYGMNSFSLTVSCYPLYEDFFRT